MPRLRRLSGREIIRILESFGFAVVRISGSHHHLKRVVDDAGQSINVPAHGKRPLPTGTLRSIYRQACVFIPEEELRPHFYTD